MSQQNKERYYDVSIYPDGQELKDVPHFDLDIFVKQSSAENKKQKDARVKVTYSKFKEQDGYNKFQLQLYKAILQLDGGLERWLPTIFYRCLEVYVLVSDLKVGQADFLGGKRSHHVTSQLAQVFRHYKPKKLATEYAEDTSSVTFSIKGIEFDIRSVYFTDWLINLIKQKLIDDEVPYSLGVDIVNLRTALLTVSSEQMNVLAKAQPIPSILEGRKVIASFCNAIHSTICAIQDKDVTMFESQQLKLYSTLCQLFELPGNEEYRLNHAENSKMATDRFRKLLKRNSDI